MAPRWAQAVLGTTIGDVHETSGTAFVFYDRVLKSVHERQQNVSRVLAYAMAHEMGRLLLPHPAHSSSGIMRPQWDGDDLRHIASGSLQFTAVQAKAIRAKVSTCCAATAARTSAGVPLLKPLSFDSGANLSAPPTHGTRSGRAVVHFSVVKVNSEGAVRRDPTKRPGAARRCRRRFDMRS